MSVETLPMEEPVLVMPPAAPTNYKIPAKIMAYIDEQLMNSTVNATEKAYKYADALIKPIIETTEKKLAQMEAPTARVLAVKIDTKPMKKLKSEAVTYLGQMIVHAKLREVTMLTGPAGCGKTTAIKQLAEALEIPYTRLALTRGLFEPCVWGRWTKQGWIEGPLPKAFKEGGLYFADDFDRGDDNFNMTFQPVMEQDCIEVTNPLNGEICKRHDNFVFVTATNTLGKGADAIYTAATRLDGATLDRVIQILVDYDEKLELKLTNNHDFTKMLQLVRKKLREQHSDEIISTRKIVRSYRLLQAGIKPADIIKSLTCSWSDETKKVFKTVKEELKADAVKKAEKAEKDKTAGEPF